MARQALLRLHPHQSFAHVIYGHHKSLQHRIYQHKTKQFPGFTSKYNINRLVYFEVFEYVRNAIDREKEIKSWTRAKRVALIESKNPKWDDLSQEWGKPETFRFTPAKT